MKNNEKGLIQVLIAVGIVALVAFIGYMVYVQNLNKQAAVSAVPSPYQAQYQQAGQTVGSIQNSADLNTASASLDSTNTTQLDTNLNALNSASSGF